MAVCLPVVYMLLYQGHAIRYVYQVSGSQNYTVLLYYSIALIDSGSVDLSLKADRMARTHNNDHPCLGYSEITFTSCT